MARDTASPVGELYRRAGFKGGESTGTLADMVEALVRIPLACDPGTRWIYGISTDLVGYLCEVISGLPFDRYLEERILGPLGMVDTGFWVPVGQARPLRGQLRAARGLRPATRSSTTHVTSSYARPRTYFSGAGGLVSTAADYLRFCQMLANGGELDGVRILGPRTLALMTLNHLPGGQDLATVAPERGRDAAGRAGLRAGVRGAARPGGGADHRHAGRVLLGRRRLDGVLRESRARS